jgi:hypothetical protein
VEKSDREEQTEGKRQSGEKEEKRQRGRDRDVSEGKRPWGRDRGEEIEAESETGEI